LETASRDYFSSLTWRTLTKSVGDEVWFTDVSNYGKNVFLIRICMDLISGCPLAQDPHWIRWICILVVVQIWTLKYLNNSSCNQFINSQQQRTLLCSVPNPDPDSPGSEIFCLKDPDHNPLLFTLNYEFFLCVKKFASSSWLHTQYCKNSKVEDFDPFVSWYKQKMRTFLRHLYIKEGSRSRFWFLIWNSWFSFWGSGSGTLLLSNGGVLDSIVSNPHLFYAAVLWIRIRTFLQDPDPDNWFGSGSGAERIQTQILVCKTWFLMQKNLEFCLEVHIFWLWI